MDIRNCGAEQGSQMLGAAALQQQQQQQQQQQNTKAAQPLHHYPQHMRPAVVSSKDTFNCEYPGCGKKYSRIDTLRNHYKKAHDITSPPRAGAPTLAAPPPARRAISYSRLPFKNTYAARLRSSAASALLVPMEKRVIAVEDSDDNESMLDVDTVDTSDNGADNPDSVPVKHASASLQRTIVVDGKRTMRKTRHDPIPKHVMKTIADSQELLVPINIELEVNGSVLHDTFTWNFNEKFLTPEKYASLLCEDLDIPAAQYASQIAGIMRTQIAEFSQYYIYHDMPSFPDSRITIKLDLALGQHKLVDRFEWDLSSGGNGLSPEEFAKVMVADLNLGGEYVTVIAHAIQEQIIKAKMEDELEVQAALESGFREPAEVADYAPFIQPMAEIDYERAKIDQERRSRRRRRESKGGQLSRNRRYSERERSNRDEDPDRPRPTLDPSWRCEHCQSANGVDACAEGVYRDRLCRPCGAWFLFTEELPHHRKELFKYAA